MAEYLIQDSTLTSIADAIREKTGEITALTPAAMATAIAGIVAGGGLPDGFSALTSGTITPASAIDISVEVEHGLGVVPNFMMILAGSGFDITVNRSIYVAYFVANGFTYRGSDVAGLAEVQGAYDESIAWLAESIPSTNPFDEVFAHFPMENLPLTAGVTYLWILGMADNLT